MFPRTRRGVLAAAGALLLPDAAGSAPDAPDADAAMSFPDAEAAMSLPGADALSPLTAAPVRQPLLGAGQPDTPIWAYAPGPVLRAHQGETLRVRLENRLPQPTSLHWHGLRLDNALDAAILPPLPPGASRDYALPLPDAGTRWYHPHHDGAEQMARGLAGALIVAEASPPAVDRDILWTLRDWRLRPDGAIAEDFSGMREMARAGRIGTLVTLNGARPADFAVQAGERLRLRLLNVANARIFALRFTGHAPLVVALDGNPVDPHPPEDGLVVLAPGQRADLILDCTSSAGDRAQVTDEAYGRLSYRLLDLVYAPGRRRAAPLRDAVRLAPNPVPEPELAGAQAFTVVLHGGTVGLLRPGLRDARARGMAWTVNGHATAADAPHQPLATFRHGASVVLGMRNETAFPHPLHLHGHTLLVLARNGRPVPYRLLRDTLLLGPQERLDVAFVADRSGDWMLQSTVQEHRQGGLSAMLRVV